MNAIIFDHVRRWWWLWLACCVGCVVFVGVGEPLRPNLANVPFFPLAMYFGVVQLSRDMQRGDVIRVLRCLPVNYRQIGRAWWWVSVGLPTLTMAVVVGSVFVFVSHIMHRPISGLACFNFWLINSAWLAPVYFFYTGITSRKLFSNGPTQILFAILFILSFFGMLYGYRLFWPQTALGNLFVLLAAILAGGGYRRSETFARARLVSLPTTTDSRKALAVTMSVVEQRMDKIYGPITGKGTFAKSVGIGRGGLRLLFQTIFYPIFGLGMFMVVTAALILHGALSTGNDAGFASIFWPVFSLFPWIATLVVTPRNLLQARYLRSLPVTPVRLAGVYIFAPLSAMAAFMCLSNLILGLIYSLPQLSFLSMLYGGCLVQVALTTLLVPLVLWRGMDAVVETMAVVLLAGGTRGVMWLHKNLPFSWDIGVSVGLVLGSFLLTLWLLKYNSHTYQLRRSPRGFFAGPAGQQS